MTKATETILKALEEVQERIRTLPAERLEAEAWTAWQRLNMGQANSYQPDELQEAYEAFEEDWKSGDLYPMLVWSWLASKYGVDRGGDAGRSG